MSHHNCDVEGHCDCYPRAKCCYCYQDPPKEEPATMTIKRIEPTDSLRERLWKLGILAAYLHDQATARKQWDALFDEIEAETRESERWAWADLPNEPPEQSQ